MKNTVPDGKMRFPESEELPEGVKEIEVKDTFGYCTELYPDVEYAEHSGKKLHLQIMTPLVYGQDLKWPLIVYVQDLPGISRNCFRAFRHWCGCVKEDMPWRSWSTEKVSLHRFRLR